MPNVQIDENTLVQMLKSKSEQGFDYLYANYSSALFGIISKITQEKDLAEDILQEAFIKIWNNIEQYDPGKGRLFTWMLNLTRNLTIDTLRSKAVAIQSKIQDVENSVHTIDAQHQTKDSTDSIGVKSLLDKLPEEHKKIIDLMYYQGYSQSEISEEFNIPLGTVKTRARYAMNKLRELFGVNLTANNK